MSVILHISDIHFGRVNNEVVEALRHEIKDVYPDLVTISGDFTQVGTPEEFAAARKFIDSFPAPVFTVPGNHDIPYKNILARFFDPYGRYQKYINPDLCPVLESDDFIMVGLNTARRIVPHWNWAHGMISDKQIEFVRRAFTHCDRNKYRILVCHHPIKDFADMPIKTIVWNADKLRRTLLDIDVNMVLTGHVHHASLTYESDETGRISYVGAATATSSRLRTHQNGYNLITVNGNKATVEHRLWNGEKFEAFDKNTQKQAAGH